MKTSFLSSRWLDRLPVGRQLFGAFAVVLVLTATLGASAVLGLRSVDAEAVALSNKWLQGVNDLAQVRALVIESREFEIKHSRTDDSSYHDEYEEKMAEAATGLDALAKGYKSRLAGDEETALYATLAQAWGAYRQGQQRVIKLGQDQQQMDAADIADGASSMAFDEALGALDGLLAFNQAGGAAAAEHVSKVYEQATLTVLALLGAALVLGATLATVITRHLLRQLGGEPATAVALAKAVAEGDLSSTVTLRPGDRASLLAMLQAMQTSLAQAVADVRRGSDHVAHASGEIAQGNQDLSGRTEQQASELQQTASTMEELGSTVRNNADNARQASQLAQGASTVAVQGGEVVGRVVETMKGINESSRRIADIIGTIDGIAFQTNILALNAAVEAARAGEQGRGFAVVAGEVRNLAQRSAEAAKEIKSLIGTSVERVEQGSALVDQAGVTMQEVVASIRRVTDIVGEISAASSEQSSGVAQVGQAITRMDQGTQQNAALVEQSAAAAESLKTQAQQLVKAVAVFKLGQDPQAGPGFAATPTPTPTPAKAPAPAPAHAPVAARPKPVAAASKAPSSAPTAAPAAAQAVEAGDDWQSF